MDESPIQRPVKKKKRRRLKKKVKRTLYGLIIVISILIIRPWNFLAQTDTNTPNSQATALANSVTPINQIVSNADSDIPEAEKFDKTILNFMRKWEITGASLAIMKDGNLIYSKGYGYADKENLEPMEVRHILRIASISKLITAVGIMKLYEQKRLSLNSFVFGPKGILSEYTEYTDKKLEKITVEHLLRHSAGFTVKAGDPLFESHKLGLTMPVTSDAMIGYVLSHGIRYTPGTRTNYSNFGYIALEKIIEKLTGAPYETYIKDSILNPASCYDMHIGNSTRDTKRHNEVCYYDASDAEPMPAADGSGQMVPKCNGGNNIRLLGGAGGWIASPVELLQLVAAIDPAYPQQNILSPKTISTMLRIPDSGLPIGWSNLNDTGDWWRSGSMSGTSAMLRRQNNGYTWVFITNTNSWRGSKFASQINTMLRQAFQKVTAWPEKDLLDMTTQTESPIISNKSPQYYVE